MSEEEKNLVNKIERWINKEEEYFTNKDLKELLNILDKYVELYRTEQEKNKELEEYANWHIEHLTENIADYIDDDRKGNASIIGEFKEEREHWKDIIRIINNEKTYIDYKNY